MYNFLIIFLSVFFIGCEQKPQVRHYTEIIIPATSVGNGFKPFPTKIIWDLPSGWDQGLGDHLRLATFHLAADTKAFDCSIVSLPGPAEKRGAGVPGGLEANLKRWMGQINLNVSQEQLAQFMAASQNHIFDFTRLQNNQDPLTDSMIAAMIEVGGDTIFVKMKGSIAAVSKNRESFLALVQSVRLP